MVIIQFKEHIKTWHECWSSSKTLRDRQVKEQKASFDKKGGDLNTQTGELGKAVDNEGGRTEEAGGGRNQELNKNI